MTTVNVTTGSNTVQATSGSATTVVENTTAAKVNVTADGATTVVEPAEPVDTSDEDENTPGFVSTTLIVALLGAVVVIQRRQSA